MSKDQERAGRQAFISEDLQRGMKAANETLETIKNMVEGVDGADPALEVIAQGLLNVAEMIAESTEAQRQVQQAITETDSRATIANLSEELKQARKTNLMMLDSLDSMVKIMSAKKILEFDSEGNPVGVRIEA